MKDVGSAAYVTHSFLANAMTFGLPQNRTRIYIVGIRADEMGESAAKIVLTDALDYLNQMKFTPPPVVAWREVTPHASPCESGCSTQSRVGCPS